MDEDLKKLLSEEKQKVAQELNSAKNSPRPLTPRDDDIYDDVIVNNDDVTTNGENSPKIQETSNGHAEMSPTLQRSQKIEPVEIPIEEEEEPGKFEEISPENSEKKLEEPQSPKSSSRKSSLGASSTTSDGIFTEVSTEISEKKEEQKEEVKQSEEVPPISVNFRREFREISS